MLGGAYLCYEGFEKIWHWLVQRNNQEKMAAEQRKVHQELIAENVNLVVLEQEKIKGAIRTDFILSAEIIVIALGTVQQATFYHQVIVVSAISALMTIGVYGLVAAIVKLDDAGLYLLNSGSLKQGYHTFTGRLKRVLGNALLGFAPKLMRSLTVIGTIAMFLVGGSILRHGIAQAHHLLALINQFINQNLPMGTFIHSIVETLAPLIFDALIGLITGALVLLMVSLFSVIFSRHKT